MNFLISIALKKNPNLFREIFALFFGKNFAFSRRKYLHLSQHMQKNKIFFPFSLETVARIKQA